MAVLKERVAEVMDTDDVTKAEAYVTAAHLMLNEANHERAGIVAQINAIAANDGHTVDWGEFAPDATNFVNERNSDTLARGKINDEGGNDGQNNTREDGTRPLGAVATGENSRTATGRGIQRSDSDGSKESVRRDIGLDATGISGARGGGSGIEAFHSPATGGTRPRRLGRDRTGGSGSAVSENDVRSERPGQRDRADLTPRPTQNNAPSIPAQNFRITNDVRLGKGGEVEKFNDNLLAIRTLKAIESENRRATPTEQAILARYVGWGGLANAFPDPLTGEYKDAWKKRGPELAALLSHKELALASRSTLDSHYTSQTVVNAMWDAARQLGFKGGLTLESSMGTGNFLGLIPDDLAHNTKFVGVEYDSLTSRIAQALYPHETVLNSGFQNVPLTDGAFDLSIGNPPFGNQSLRFQFKPELNRLSIHNQFTLASLDAVKPDGLQVEVVSRYLLDAADATARKMLASKAKLLAAIRLPDTAFRENARTQVVTDILFLQRLNEVEQGNMEAAFAAARRKPERNQEAEQQRQTLAAQVPAWVNVTKVPDPLGGEPMQVNNYFQQNPHMIMGTLERSGSMQHGKDITVRLENGGTLAEMLKAAVASLPENVMAQQQSAIDASIARHKAMSDSLHIALEGNEQGSIVFHNDGSLQQVIERETPEGDYELTKRTLSAASPWAPDLYMNAQGQWYRIEPVLDTQGKNVKVMKGDVATNRNLYERKVFTKEADIPAGALLGQARFSRLKELVGVRDLLKQQLTLEAEDAPAKTIETNRRALNSAYKKFVDGNGFVSEPSNSALVQNMPDGALVQALEHGYRPAVSKAKAEKIGEKARDASAKPAPILSERVIRKYEPPKNADSQADALSISLAESGRVDMDRIASLLGLPKESVSSEMLNAEKPLIFTDPETGDIVSRNEYLSGQVVRKLEAARNAVLPQNVKALTEVQPEPWGAENVTPILGAAWIPAKTYKDFIDHISGGNSRVRFSPLTNSYSIENSAHIRANENEWGTSRMSSTALINDLLNSRATKVVDYDRKGTPHINQEETALAVLKAKAISSEFNDWVFKDSDRRNELVSMFNQKFNTVVNRQHDGSHLILPGKVPDAVIAMRRHQKNAIWRGIAERFMMLDHAVGAGKTFTMIARAMERRRMGLSKKTMIVVPNHMVGQFTSDAYRLYPGAKVLAAGKADFERSKRRKLFAKIATGDHDIVIVPHSSFFFIPIAKETEQRYLEGELKAAEEAIQDAEDAAKESGNDTGYRKPFGVKEAERLRDKITARMEMLKGDGTKDNLLTFEQMGIDDLSVDEAHEFKNLFYSSRLTGVKGMGNKAGSQKAFDLYNKIRVLRESPTGTVTFATGTPISNSAVEMYTMMRYLAADKLSELGLDHFDAWRSQFVSTDAGWEPNETGRLKEVNRLGRTWSNMRSLMDLYNGFTDSVSNEDIKKAYAEDNNGEQFPIPKIAGGGRESVVVQPTEAQSAFLHNIIAGFDGLPKIDDPYERNIARLKLMDRARKVSLDVRAVDPGSPSDEKGGKLDVVADEIHELYKQWDSDRGTQLVFLDRSVPKAREDTVALKNYDALLQQQSKALANNDDEALRRVGESLEQYDPNAMEEMRLAQNGGWNAYQQIKDNLIKRGIPANEIRFVQEANNDAQKQALFDSVNDGTTRVLLGSTPRMGAGTNVQQRLVGLHHVDVTWKPSDIEQREGRIERQGNSLLEKYGMDKFEAAIKAYATERTIDAKMWSLNASKLKMINGIRHYNGQFSMDFEDDSSVSMAELAALASGDPLLLERVKLMSEIDALELLKRQHARKEWGIITQIEDAQRDIKNMPSVIAKQRADLDMLQRSFTDQSDKVAERKIEVEGKAYYTPEEAKKAAYAAQKEQQEGDDDAKFSIAINGKRKASQTSYMEEVSHVFGDAADFEMTMDGDKYIGRTDAARYIAEQAAKKTVGMTKDKEVTEQLGSYLGLPLEATYSKNWADYNITTLAVLRPDGSTLASGQTNPLEAYSTSGMRMAISTLDNDLDVTLRKGKVADAEQRLKMAKASLPDLEARKGGEFAKQDELDTKNARLEQVIQELSQDKAAQAKEGDPLQNDVPLPDATDAQQAAALNEGVNASGNASVLYSRQSADADAGTYRVGAAISRSDADKIVGGVVSSFKNGLAGTSIRVVDSFHDLPTVIKDAAIRDNAENAIDGVHADNTIYLVRDKHSTAQQFEQTLLHELYGHQGFNKLFGPYLDQRVNDLFHAIGGMKGLNDIANRHNIDLSEYHAALANEDGDASEQHISTMMSELLAHIAEDRPTLRMKIHAFIGMLRSWLRAHGFMKLSYGTDADLYHLLKQSRDALGQRTSPFDGGLSHARSQYKRSLGDALAQAGNSIKEVRLPADYVVGDLFNGAGKLNWWHKTIGTQYNLATRSPLFKAVYDRVQNFIGDVSSYANEAADLAPTIIPKLEQMSDIWKKSPLSPVDTKAIAAPIFEGTLTWARGIDGKPLKLADVEAAAKTLSVDQKAQVLLRKGTIDDDQNKRWLALPKDDYDSEINDRFEQSELQGGIVWKPEELRSIFGLNDKQIGLYQEFRAATDRSIRNLAISDMVKFGGQDAKGLFDAAMATGSVEKAGEMLRDHFMELAKTEPDRTNSHLDTASQMIGKADKAQNLMDRGYAPLSRYGDYTVYVSQGGEEKYFGMFEDKAEAAKMARQMRANYPDATITHGTMSKESYKLFQGVSPETVELFGAMLGLDNNDAAGNEAYQAYLKLAKNNRSAMKRLIQRKGIAGFSEDSGRVLAGFLYSNSKLTAMNAHMGELNSAIEAIPKHQGELKDAAVKLAEHIKNPQGGGSALGGLMFAQYLGGSVASAMVNLTQPFTMAFPYLSQYGGVGKSAARMLDAVRLAGKKTTGDAKLDAAMKWATDEGIVSPQEIHQLKAQANGKGVLQSGDGTKFGDTRAAIGNTMSKISLGWGKLFSMAELTNRRVTFIAAYKTAIEEGIANPEKFAADAVAATQGVYNAGNKPTWGRTTIGGLAMTFKQFSISNLELLSRMATAGEPGSPERAAGRKGAMTMAAVLMLLGGVNGLPFEQDAEDVIDGILQRMGYNFSSKREKQEFLINALGQDGSDVALHGLSGLPGVPIDVAGRFGLGKLVPGTGFLVKKDSHASDVADVFGPVADLAKRAFDSGNKLADGRVLDAASDLLPASLRNIQKGADMLNTGIYRDDRGYKVNDVSPTEAVMKMIGFQPNSTDRVKDADEQARDVVGQTKMASKEIQEQWAQGLASGDKEMVNDARKVRDDWNAKNPDTPIIISMPAVVKRVQEMRMSALDRTQKTAPKALKSSVHRELSEV
jgi:N12 class adenine-specific DNA methylase/adenine-specific DNA methylase